jgi:hypothetical protein
MADGYTAPADQTIAASPGATLVGVTASTLLRARLVELWAAVEGTPADQIIRWLVRRYTAAGTSSAVTPGEEDLDGPPAQLSAGSNHTVEPTYAGTALLDIPVHLRNQLLWRARDPQKGWLIPATAASGIGLTPIHPSVTNDVRGTAVWVE